MLLPAPQPLPAVHMLGTAVASRLDDYEKRLHGELTVLDRHVSWQRQRGIT